jgi:hypothetical protein
VSSGDLFWIKVVFAIAVAAIGLSGTYLPWVLGRRGLDDTRFGGGLVIFRGFLTMRGTDDGIYTEEFYRGVQGVRGRIRDQ